MRFYTLIIGLLVVFAAEAQSIKDTIPAISRISFQQVRVSVVKPDVEGVMVYETMVVSQRVLSAKATRKMLKILSKTSAFTSTASNSRLPNTEANKPCTTKNGDVVDHGSSPQESEKSGSVQVSMGTLTPMVVDLDQLSSGAVSTRYTHLVNFMSDKYTMVCLCLNTLEKSVRIYCYMQPPNLKQAFDATKPYIFSATLSTKAKTKISKYL
ncbi:MAG: hypothetical protein EB023_05010 [Flavobacteriia bacterium]|nr:hypothetical protein [Flavobacteriia bacterium]